MLHIFFSLIILFHYISNLANYSDNDVKESNRSDNIGNTGIVVHERMNDDNIALRDEAIFKFSGNFHIDFYDDDFKALEYDELTVGIASVYSSYGIDIDEPMLIGTRYLENLNKSLFYKGNIFPLNTSEESQRKVMIIGIGTNPKIREQWDSVVSPMDTALLKRSPLTMLTIPALNEFTFINKANKEIPYSPAIMSDFLRAIVLENMFHPCKVYTVTICNDEVRNAEYLGNDAINCNINDRAFLTEIRNKRWQVDQIFIDHYRNSNPYLVEMLKPQFFRHLKELGRETDDILAETAISESGRAEIYIPFAPYTVVSVINHRLRVEFQVLYIIEADLQNEKLNLLHSATNSNNHKKLLKHFNIVNERKGKSIDRIYLQYKLKQVYDYAEGYGLQRGQIKRELSSVIDNIPDVRYICLTQRLET